MCYYIAEIGWVFSYAATVCCSVVACVYGKSCWSPVTAQ